MLYLRISEDRTGEALGVERQEEALRELCDERAWQVSEVISDNDRSATRGWRPGFARLLDLIEARAMDLVLVWVVDRLVRQPVELETLIDACGRHGVRIITVGGELDLSTDSGRLVARILTSVARAEIERKSARQAAAFLQAAKAGKPSGGPRAFGYTADGRDLVPDEAEVLKEVYALFNADATLGEVCRLLNARGVLTPRGNAWTTGSLREVLLNPRNCALRGVKWLEVDAEGRPVLDERGRQRRQRFHSIIGPATWPAAVDESVWRTASERLRDENRRKHYKGNRRKYLLSSVAVCAIEGCGQPLRNKTNNRARALHCPELRHVCRKAEPVERFVEDVILERLRRPDAIDLVQARPQGVDLAALRDEATAMRERLREMARAEALGRRTRDEVEAAREAVLERLDEIDRMVTEAGRVDVVAAFVGTGRDPAEVWNDPRTTLAMKQAVIRALAVIRVGSGRNGRPPKYSVDAPPPRVFVDWHHRDDAGQ